METLITDRLEDALSYIKDARASLMSISDTEYFRLFDGLIDAPLSHLAHAENSILAALHSENY